VKTSLLLATAVVLLFGIVIVIHSTLSIGEL